MKFSRFNYFTRNDSKELLLFNTLRGPESFIKISKENADEVEEYLLKKKDTVSSRIIDELIDYGYIIPDDYDENAILRKKYLDSVEDGELSLTLIPTNNCNFRCRYCYESFQDSTMSEDLVESIILYISKNIKHYSSLHISWFGGEPLLEIDMIESLTQRVKKICSFYKKPFTASITTNGFLLDIETFRRLMRCNVLYYQITIDGVKKIHDYQRPHHTQNVSTYDKIIQNLLSIKECTISRTFKIIIRSNFSKINFEHIEEYKQTFFDLFGDDDRFWFFVRPVMDWGGDAISGFKDKIIERHNFKTMYDLLQSGEKRLRYIYSDFLKNGGAVCYAGKANTYIINTKGEIYKCTCHFEGCSDAKIGKMNCNGEMILDEERTSKWICDFSYCNKECFYSPICFMNSCSAIRVLKKENKTLCPLEKINLPDILKLLDLNNNAFRRL